MGYTLYITRTETVPPSDGGITWGEFVRLLRRDASLRRDGQTPGMTVLYQPGPAEPTARLVFEKNAVACCNPDEPTVDKLVALAGELSAKVRGEDGERYVAGSARPEFGASAPGPRRHRLRVRFPGPLVTTPVQMEVAATAEGAVAVEVAEAETHAETGAAEVDGVVPEGAPQTTVETETFATEDGGSSTGSTIGPPAEPGAFAEVEAHEPMPEKTPTMRDVQRANRQARGGKVRKMPIGFPDGQREPSGAIRALLNPLAKPEPKVKLNGVKASGEGAAEGQKVPDEGTLFVDVPRGE